MELINISGEPREFAENGFIYEFPYPASTPTKVPDEVGEKLMTTGNYKKANDNWNKPVKKNKEKEKLTEEVKENAI